MNAKPAIIALLVTILLAAAAFFVLRAPSTSTSSSLIRVGSRVFDFDPTAVVAISIGTEKGKQVLDRHPDGTWYWRDTLHTTTQYRLDETRVQALFRILLETNSLATPAPDANLPVTPKPVTLTLHLPDAKSIDIRFATRGLGGQVLCEVLTPSDAAPRRAYVREDLAVVLTNPGPSAWRDDTVFADIPAVARVTLTDATGNRGFSLARHDGLWNLTAPVAAPTNPEAVAKLLGVLESLRVARWFDGTAPTPDAAGLTKPAATLLIERDVRTFDPATQEMRSRTETSTLAVGFPCDATGAVLFASTDRNTSIVGIDATKIAALASGGAATLIAPPALSVPASEVGAIHFTGKGTVTLKRIEGVWHEIAHLGATSIAQAPNDPNHASRVLTALLNTRPDVIGFDAPPPDTAHLGTVSLTSTLGAPLGEVELYRFNTDSTVVLVIRTGNVFRRFNAPNPALVHWLDTAAR